MAASKRRTGVTLSDGTRLRAVPKTSRAFSACLQAVKIAAQPVEGTWLSAPSEPEKGTTA